VEIRSLKFISDSVAGELRQGPQDLQVCRICTDSRQARPGDLFVAIRGDRFDGHDFIQDLAARGVAALLVTRERAHLAPPGCGVVAVDDTRKALGRLAARYRREFQPTLIAVGGSNGKTTTKELIAAVLRQTYNTLSSEASFNNDIGVPITLLNLDRTHGAGVLEVGTNHPGELAPLVRLIQPRLGVLTSIGREHLEYFGDLDGVAEEEGWLAELLPADGRLFIPGDVPGLDRILLRTRARVVRVGFETGNDWQATQVRLTENGLKFHATSLQHGALGEFQTPLLGRHQAINALLALAVGSELGVGKEAMRRALAGCTPPKMRLQVWEANGVRFLDDTYNANADSMAAALQTLRDLPCTGRRVAVLGDMAELGAQTVAAHIETGRRAADLGLDRLITVGRMAAVTADAARAAGLRNASHFDELVAAGAALKSELGPGDLVLVKASRSSRLERLFETLSHAA
jgi:UDP-N-acetylmuramoyl-tripeptide--D-alanyl-D-alanine ligase